MAEWTEKDQKWWNDGRTSAEVKAKEKQVYWLGDVPSHCQIQEGLEITDRFVDGVTRFGPWACMHPDTHAAIGAGLGAGRGQLYEKQPNGRWLKIEG